MCDIQPETVRFSIFQRSTKNFRAGIAIAKNESGYFRVQYLEDEQVQYAEIPPDRIFPLEQARVTGPCEHFAVVHDAMAALELERNQLRAEGAIAPEHCWIETGKVKGREFRQAWWRSEQAMFESKRSRGKKVKSCYIGEEGSPEHQEAKQQKYRRDRLKVIDRYLEMLMRFDSSQ